MSCKFACDLAHNPPGYPPLCPPPHPIPPPLGSTVIHERGSPETLRDPRGFAVKFYTREGNFDMVGNNMPVSERGGGGTRRGWGGGHGTVSERGLFV
jgi:hypothetical protein